MKKEIPLKSYIIIIAITTVILLIFLLIYIYITKQTSEIILNTQDISEDLLDFVSYEGTFKAKGVVVRPEEKTLTIMPIVSNKEYSNCELFYYENNNELNLNQGQEVIVTFHYNQSASELHTYEAIIENIEIIKEKSDIEIPNDIFVKAYSTKNNISITVDTNKSNNQKIEFTITDTNKLKYNYSTMQYYICKYTPPPEKTEIIYNESGASIAGYDPWPILQKINDIPSTSNYQLNQNGQLNVTIDWTKLYGTLPEGEYKLTFSTVSTPKPSILNPNNIDYPYDGVIINISFKLDTNGIMETGELNIY